MPAVTVDDLTILPRVAPVDPATPGRARSDRHDRAARLRGRGLPRPPRVRRRRPGAARPVHPHGPDGRGRVRAGRAEGHRLAPAPRLRDRHVHHRRHVRAPGLPRRRRRHHQRRHPVDDRRRRHPAHRDAAGGRSSSAAGCSTACSCGSTCPRAQKWAAPRYQDLRGQRGRAALLAPTAARCCASSPATSPGTPARAHPHPDHDGARHRLPGRPAHPALARRTSTRWRTSWPAPARSVTEQPPGRTGQRGRLRPRRHPHHRGRRAQESRSPRSRSCCSAASRSASRWRGTARS